MKSVLIVSSQLVGERQYAFRDVFRPDALYFVKDYQLFFRDDELNLVVAPPCPAASILSTQLDGSNESLRLRTNLPVSTGKSSKRRPEAMHLRAVRSQGTK